MINKKFLLEGFENFTRTSLQYGHKFYETLQKFYQDEIRTDWQLQGAVFFLCLFCVLMILVNMKWNKYGSTILGMKLENNKSYDNVDYPSGLETVQEFPDEDPLTFVKKKTQ